MICKRCGGILLGGEPPSGTVTKIVNGEIYHLICGMKTELELKEKDHEKPLAHDPNFVRPRSTS